MTESTGAEMNPPSPHMLPLGYPQPPNDIHAVSVSMPTWDSVTGVGLKEEGIVGKMQTPYPRFFIHSKVQALSDAVRARLAAMPQDAKCMIFPSERAAGRFVGVMRAEDITLRFLEVVRFSLPHALASEEGGRWATFFAALYPDDADVQKAASNCWCKLGDGISSRHAMFCLERFEYMESFSEKSCYKTAPKTSLSAEMLPVVPWTVPDTDSKDAIRSLIANSNSRDEPGKVTSNDVFLYPKGMSGINAVARVVSSSISDEAQSEAVLYGWSYADVPKAIPMSPFTRFKMYHNGSASELASLESSLSSGQNISILFCEIPSNPLSETIDIQRIRELADTYGFIVACDQTLGGFVNLDLLPFVDLLMDSLTKGFSGGSNVMGGSVIVNPASKHHANLHSLLKEDYEDIFFPLDAQVLACNSADFETRIHRFNDNALALATLLKSHPSVSKVYYPNMVSSAPLYEKIRRRSSTHSGREGGYGFVLSLTFHNPSSSIAFYDALDVCKGPSLGTNFTLAVPYAQLAHFQEQDWVGACGVDRGIVRISAGLEDEHVLVSRVEDALRVVEGLERQQGQGMGGEARI